MVEGDWRLTNQLDYLKGKTLRWKRWIAPRPSWDHDHCDFCMQKFAEGDVPDAVQEGYTTEDDYHWICEGCFNDFRELFEWKLIDKG